MALGEYEVPLSDVLVGDIYRAFEVAYQTAQAELEYREVPPELRFSLKSGRMAARAHPHKNLIELNKVIFRNNAHWDFIYDTVAHEMAHIVASRKFRSRGHDSRWKTVAQALGATPKASAVFDTSGASVRRAAQRKSYPFRCRCQGFDFGGQRLSNFLKGSRYQCRTCKFEILPDIEQREAFVELSRTRYAKLLLRSGAGALKRSS